MLKPTLLLFSILFCPSFVNAQQNEVYIDENGILRLTRSKQEAAFFGVNYAAPFAHSFRSLKKMGIDIKKTIDADAAHFKRLELNAFRIHVWDREVSDREGNLLNNEHIDLFDYLLHKLKENNIKVIITPIAWWGTGWPEPDVQTPGFSTFYSKVEMITDSSARKAQRNYLKQILNHVNKYDKVTYKDDPNIIAWEIINEPHHQKDTSLTSSYIKEMLSVIRGEGVTKPVYYNISENWSKEEAEVVYKSDVQGISFQWYPTGLVKRSELIGNYLPHVDHYPVPVINDKNFLSKSRMVYEFDAADKSGSYMYPAMARSFKEAGMQWATMFCYDPLYMAPFNTEYQTHYLNLLYTPQKAVSFLIAGNIFRKVNAYTKFQSYPANLSFGDFSISYEDNLSEMNSDTAFYYSNNTGSAPKNVQALKHIAGYGSSPVVSTDSRGAYFLDKISQGSWSLEVYPDAVWIQDPFGANSLDTKVADLYYTKSRFKINLPDLGTDFFVSGGGKSDNGSIEVKPGKYILAINKPGLKKFSAELNDFYIPAQQKKETVVLHKPVKYAYEGDTLIINTEVYSERDIKQVQLFIRSLNWGGFTKSNFTRNGKYNYSVPVQSALLKNGILEYCITVISENDTITYPGKVKGTPGQWDFQPGNLWQLKVLPAGSSLVLFDPAEDYGNLILPGIWDKVEYSGNIITDNYDDLVYEIKLNKIKRPLDDFTFQIELDNILKTINPGRLKSFTGFVVELYNGGNIDTMYFSLITDDVKSAGAVITGSEKFHNLEAGDFHPADFVLLPRPYPKFLPYYFSPASDSEIDFYKTGYLQIKIPMKGFDESKNGSWIRLGKIRLIHPAGQVTETKN